MALQNIEANITLDLYNHDTTPSTVKAIQLDSQTRYVAARLQNMGAQYDVDSGATVQLIVVRPDKVGVQITGTTFTYGDEGAQFLGPYAELTQVALAVNGKMRGQFKITSGTQILRTEIFAISNGEALDASTDEWADEYDGYNLEEMATSIETNTADIATLEADVSQIKEELSSTPSIATPEDGDADLYVCDKDGNVLAKFEDGHIKTKNFDSANLSASEPFDTFTASGNFVVGSPLTITVVENFKKGDEVYFHLDDGLAFYDYGAYATYYEANRVVINNHRGSNDYVRHIITDDCSSVKVVVGGTAYTSAREITLYVYRKNYDPEPKIVTVKADGTGMFTTLKSAVESITDANHATNPYVIEVYEGTYNTLDGFTQEEINSADVGGGYTQTSMVGVKLTDGISLRGVGRCDNIILTAELDNSYSSEVRGNISTLNLQGEGSLENVTIFGKNIRYCVHDDFRAPLGSHHKRVVKRCKFNGEALAYSPYMTTYGAGMTAPRDYLIEDCDFGFTIGIHSNRGYAFGCTIELNNCSGSSFALGDSADDGDAFNRVIINNCNFQRISVEHKNGASTSHMMIEGVGNENTMVYDPLTTPYRLGMIDLAPTGLTVGKMVKRILGSFSLENTTDKNIAHGIVVGADNNFCYVQKCGYISANMLNLSGLTVGDYITVDNTGSVTTGGSASDAIGIVVATNSATAFIKMLIGGAS